MCPACFSVAAWLVVGSASAGGVLTLASASLKRARRTRTREFKTELAAKQ